MSSTNLKRINNNKYNTLNLSNTNTNPYSPKHINSYSYGNSHQTKEEPKEIRQISHIKQVSNRTTKTEKTNLSQETKLKPYENKENPKKIEEIISNYENKIQILQLERDSFKRKLQNEKSLSNFIEKFDLLNKRLVDEMDKISYDHKNELINEKNKYEKKINQIKDLIFQKIIINRDENRMSIKEGATVREAVSQLQIRALCDLIHFSNESYMKLYDFNKKLVEEIRKKTGFEEELKGEIRILLKFIRKLREVTDLVEETEGKAEGNMKNTSKYENKYVNSTDLINSNTSFNSQYIQNLTYIPYISNIKSIHTHVKAKKTKEINQISINKSKTSYNFHDFHDFSGKTTAFTDFKAYISNNDKVNSLKSLKKTGFNDSIRNKNVVGEKFIGKISQSNKKYIF